MKKKSGLFKIIGLILTLVVGVFIGKTFFARGPVETVPMPTTMKYRNVGLTKDTTQTAMAEEFTGEIIQVKKGESIQKAVQDAKSGDLIQVHPGTYHETVYIDKDNI